MSTRNQRIIKQNEHDIIIQYTEQGLSAKSIALEYTISLNALKIWLSKNHYKRSTKSKVLISKYQSFYDENKETLKILLKSNLVFKNIAKALAIQPDILKYIIDTDYQMHKLYLAHQRRIANPKINYAIDKLAKYNTKAKSLPHEVWRPYQNSQIKTSVTYVSNLGRVKAVKMVSKFENITLDKPREKMTILKPYVTHSGYLLVKVGTVNKHPIRKSVHRLVANAFLKPKKNKPYVNHKNGNKADNRLENLEYCNQSENNLHYQINIKHKSHNVYKKVIYTNENGKKFEFSSLESLARFLKTDVEKLYKLNIQFIYPSPVEYKNLKKNNVTTRNINLNTN